MEHVRLADSGGVIPLPFQGERGVFTPQTLYQTSKALAQPVGFGEAAPRAFHLGTGTRQDPMTQSNKIQRQRGSRRQSTRMSSLISLIQSKEQGRFICFITRWPSKELPQGGALSCGQNATGHCTHARQKVWEKQFKIPSCHHDQAGVRQVYLSFVKQQCRSTREPALNSAPAWF